MLLSSSQLSRFWREWAATCRARSWTRADGLTTDEIDLKRKEFLATCGFESLHDVDRTAGFTKVLNDLIALRGDDLDAGREATNPSLNRCRVLIHFIVTEQIPCLELYLEDVRGYITGIMEDKNRWWKIDRPVRDIQITDLNENQLIQLRDTMAARLNTKRNEAGRTIHEMRIAAHLVCTCSKCRNGFAPSGAPTKNPNGVQSFSPGLDAQRPTLGNNPDAVSSMPQGASPASVSEDDVPF